jgi:hypothetical protein
MRLGLTSVLSADYHCPRVGGVAPVPKGVRPLRGRKRRRCLRQRKLALRVEPGFGCRRTIGYGKLELGEPAVVMESKVAKVTPLEVKNFSKVFRLYVLGEAFRALVHATQELKPYVHVGGMPILTAVI